MSLLNILGAVIIATPFVVIFVFAGRELGWKETALVFLFAAVVMGLIAAGVTLYEM